MKITLNNIKESQEFFVKKYLTNHPVPKKLYKEILVCVLKNEISLDNPLCDLVSKEFKTADNFILFMTIMDILGCINKIVEISTTTTDPEIIDYGNTLWQKRVESLTNGS